MSRKRKNPLESRHSKHAKTKRHISLWVEDMDYARYRRYCKNLGSNMSREMTDHIKSVSANQKLTEADMEELAARKAAITQAPNPAPESGAEAEAGKEGSAV